MVGRKCYIVQRRRNYCGFRSSSTFLLLLFEGKKRDCIKNLVREKGALCLAYPSEVQKSKS